MRIYFEDHGYPKESIVPYLKEKGTGKDILPVQQKKEGWYLMHIGYLFVNSEKYTGPVFILPKTFLEYAIVDNEKKKCLLGLPGILPEQIIDTDSDKNILNAQGQDCFLPELSLWLFRAMTRYREDCTKEDDETGLENLEYITPDNSSRDRDFLSTAVRLIDYLSEHRSLFTQINKINNSGRAAVDWHKTLRQDPLVKNGKPYYLDLRIRDKAINIDEELIILYYSVLRYLKEKFHFRISYGEVPYELKTVSEIKRYLDTGAGKRKMRDIKGKYFRDDLRTLWYLLDAFFTFNTNKDDKAPIKEALVIKSFDRVFERMVDQLIGDRDKLTKLKTQKDGKLIDHIYLDKSLIGGKTSIYFIGDSKYYSDELHPEGVSLYKQFTYARNAIQYNIEQYHLRTQKNPNAIRYRDEETEGYNITPNFFIRPKIEIGNLDFCTPSFGPSEWRPKPSKHFEDRLFDRDTLLLREYNINLVFLIAAYGAYEDCWTSSIRKTIREDMVEFLNETYTFFKFEPKDIPIYSENGLIGTLPFTRYFHALIAGKAYKESDDSKEIILAFEKSAKGEGDSQEVRKEIENAVSNPDDITHPIELKS